MPSLADWINQEVRLRDWSLRELARRAGVSPTTIANISRGDHVKPATCRGLAKAFGLPVEEIYKRAGLLPERGGVLPEVLDWSERLRALTDRRRAQVLGAMEQVLRLAEAED